jgi:hypothetical protein
VAASEWTGTAISDKRDTGILGFILFILECTKLRRRYKKIIKK